VRRARLEPRDGPGADPSGLLLWGVSLEIDGTMTPVRSKPVFTYTTL
jgi:hypothetical protein